MQYPCSLPGSIRITRILIDSLLLPPRSIFITRRLIFILVFTVASIVRIAILRTVSVYTRRLDFPSPHHCHLTRKGIFLGVGNVFIL